MSRVAVCLFIIAIFQIVVPKCVQADDSASSITGEDSHKEPEIAIVSIDEAVESPESQKVNDIETTEPKKATKITNVTKKEKDGNTKKTSKSPLDQLNPDKVLTPVLRVRAQIGDAVSKSVDGVKGFADGAFGFFRDAFTSFMK